MISQDLAPTLDYFDTSILSHLGYRVWKQELFSEIGISMLSLFILHFLSRYDDC